MRRERLLSKEPGYRVAIGASAAPTLFESCVPKKHELEFKPLNETPQQLEQRTKYMELERFPESFVND